MVFFFVDFLAALEGAEAIGRLTLFHYYDPALPSSREGMLDPLNILVQRPSVSAIGLGAALLAFQRRDITR